MEKMHYLSSYFTLSLHENMIMLYKNVHCLYLLLVYSGVEGVSGVCSASPGSHNEIKMLRKLQVIRLGWISMHSLFLV